MLPKACNICPPVHGMQQSDAGELSSAKACMTLPPYEYIVPTQQSQAGDFPLPEGFVRPQLHVQCINMGVIYVIYVCNLCV